MGPFKVLVCGDRNWTDLEPMLREFRLLPQDTIIIHGDCRGADKMAGQLAKEMGLMVEAYPADWDLLGRAAGPIRNQAMLDRAPHLVLAFHKDIENSRGTRDMVNRARNAGYRVEIIKE